MTIGSPNMTASYSHGGQFLPGYLMGDVNNTSIMSPQSPTYGYRSSKHSSSVGVAHRNSRERPSAPPISTLIDEIHSPRSNTGSESFTNQPFQTRHNSPSLNPNVRSWNLSPNQKNSPMMPGMTSPTSRLYHTIHSAVRQNDLKEKVAGAPPVAMLLNDTSDFTDRSQQKGANQSVKPDFQMHSLNPTPSSPNQIDPFYSQGERLTSDVQMDCTWVTVFGFPPSNASFILQRFSQYGTILDHKVASNEGNFVHIHYESLLQAKKALSKNGKVFPGNMIIGVIPCIDMKIIPECASFVQANSVSIASPSLVSTSCFTPTGKRTNIRPLTSAYNASVSETKVINDVSTPQKSNGVLTKAMDYLFG